MQRERRYRSKLLYLVACASWPPPRDAPQAECMHVVCGPWKLRALLGMGITGMGGPAEPRARIRAEGRAGGSGGDGRAESSVVLPFAPRALALLGCCCRRVLGSGSCLKGVPGGGESSGGSGAGLQDPGGGGVVLGRQCNTRVL